MTSAISSSPFAHNNQSVRKVMLQVQVAAFPALMAHIYLFGFGIVIQWFLAVFTLILVEAVMLKLRNRPVMPFLTDMSGLITVTGLVFCIPPESPWWVIVSGCSFALIIGKHLYGGLGYNPFNPAMLGYAFLLISFPVQMTQWTLPVNMLADTPSLLESARYIFSGMPQAAVDAMTGATPLDQIRTGLSQGIAVQDSIADHYTTFFWELNSWNLINLAFLIGGIWMLLSRTISWQLPVGFLASLALISFIFHSIDPNTYPTVGFTLLSGGTMLAAFFIITDPVSASTTPRGKLVYACGIGILVYVIRNWGAFPDGIAFAILLMNIAVPLIDQYTQPRVFGHQR
ncbi:RnfABCDGE type electron transport complex subunit D [Thiomicrorhabdus sediminis]|uniref:Ion-translocating oxidoreductase complex subunit D n=1 Tax=Thiomicrorhabdus sediminis TaxID=2580412 RepID=A0A4P9K7L0_9GAMM|nr:RnfABCDGE type electron transport complex subunit D [Thiomicrorhabdus sediminis]QCU90326.1 RnfABCDGE type electron transport complex subunit D [Thiomicrorhabdus sediminis]